MDGSLWVDVAERHRAMALHNPLGREFTGGNLAEQAVRHPRILAVAPALREPGRNPPVPAGPGRDPRNHSCWNMSVRRTGAGHEHILVLSRLEDAFWSYTFRWREHPVGQLSRTVSMARKPWCAYRPYDYDLRERSAITTWLRYTLESAPPGRVGRTGAAARSRVGWRWGMNEQRRATAGRPPNPGAGSAMGPGRRAGRGACPRYACPWYACPRYACPGRMATHARGKGAGRGAAVGRQGGVREGEPWALDGARGLN